MTVDATATPRVPQWADHRVEVCWLCIGRDMRSDQVSCTRQVYLVPRSPANESGSSTLLLMGVRIRAADLVTAGTNDVCFGGPCRGRTYGPLIKSQLLYQLS